MVSCPANIAYSLSGEDWLHKHRLCFTVRAMGDAQGERTRSGAEACNQWMIITGAWNGSPPLKAPSSSVPCNYLLLSSQAGEQPGLPPVHVHLLLVLVGGEEAHHSPGDNVAEVTEDSPRLLHLKERGSHIGPWGGARFVAKASPLSYKHSESPGPNRRCRILQSFCCFWGGDSQAGQFSSWLI